MSSNRSVAVGKVLAPKGFSGEVRVQVNSDSPGRFDAGGFLYIKDERFKIQGATRPYKGTVSLKLEGVNSPEEVEALRGATITVPEEMSPSLPEGGYYHFQIIDLKVYTEEDEYLGQITQILSTGSNDVYVVSKDEKDLLIPALDEVIQKVDLASGRMTVQLPDGLR